MLHTTKEEEVMVIFVPDFFELYELVPRSMYYRYAEHPHRLWVLFDDRLLRTIHNLRERYGKMVMNTWYWGGHNHECGWRHEASDTGAALSQHKFGRAGDLMPQEVPVTQVRQDILTDPWHPDFQYITCIEMDTSWLHIDVRNRDKERYGILRVYP